MGIVSKLGLLIIVIVVLFAYRKITSVPPVPELPEPWWGPRDPTEEDKEIRPFKVHVPESVIKDLHTRLDNRIPLQPALQGVNQEYGIHSDNLENILIFWRRKYDWEERQKFLNQFPQYVVSVQGLKIHYLHVKPNKTDPKVKVLPLLLLHGWPGSVREFYEIIPILTTPQKDRDFVFEVIVPSLPGYGFSEAAVRPGLGAAQMASIFKNLMKRLNVDKYYIQGGDWGGIIVKYMSILYPEHIIGVHANMCFVNSLASNLVLFLGQFLPSLVATPEEQRNVYPLTDMYEFMVLETGYMHIQSTKPDTVGTAVRDSPAGMAAYILEKFSTWTNPAYRNLPDGGLSRKYSLTNLLDNVMIYWVTRSMTTSMRLYSETFNKAGYSLQLDEIPVKVPAACARFRYELSFPLRKILDGAYHNLVQVTDYEAGHFAAFEVPKVLAQDIFEFTTKVEILKGSKDNKEKSDL